MKLPLRILSCLLICSISTALFAQSARPLSEVQAQAKQQAAQKPWIKKYLIPSAVTVAAGGAGWLAINNARLRRQKQTLEQTTQELEKALQDYRYEVSTLREQRAHLVFQRDKALDLWENANAMLEKQQKRPIFLPAQTATKPTADGYKYLAKTELSKYVLKESPYQFAYLSEYEIRSVLQNLDRISNHKTNTALLELNSLIQKSSNISVKQLYIQAERYVKFLTVAAVFYALVVPTDLHATQSEINRLEKNPSLFLEADQQQLQRWEQNPRADALCRQIAKAIDQAAALPVTEAEAKAFTQQAAERQVLLQAKNANHLTKALAR